MSHYAYGMGWASASAGPLDLFKMTVGEGGIRSPLIVAGPGIRDGQQTDTFGYVWDVMPTILDMAGIDHPKTFKGNEVERMRGKSLAGVLEGNASSAYSDTAFVGGEMQNGKWMRQGDYKAVSVAPPYGDGQWRLYNLAKDPGETRDLANAEPAILNRLQAAWRDYAEDVGVILTE
jgi:arylsulfatase